MSESLQDTLDKMAKACEPILWELLAEIDEPAITTLNAFGE